jgi:hypothetical protein
MPGIQNTKELFIAMQELSLEIAKLLKDGAQVTDIITFWNDMIANEEMKAKLIAAVDGYKELPAEIKDIDINEAVELAAIAIAFIPKFVALIKQ